MPDEANYIESHHLYAPMPGLLQLKLFYIAIPQLASRSHLAHTLQKRGLGA